MWFYNSFFQKIGYLTMWFIKFCYKFINKKCYFVFEKKIAIYMQKIKNCFCFSIYYFLLVFFLIWKYLILCIEHWGYLTINIKNR